MIDQNGNKIIPEGKSPDPQFQLKEAKFFWKIFQKDRCADKAVGVAKRLKECADKNGIDSKEFFEITEDLEQFAETAGSAALLLELAQLRKDYASRYSFVRAGEAIPHLKRSLDHVERICKLVPTKKNDCCLVSEYSLLIIKMCGIFVNKTKEFKAQRTEYLKKTEAIFLKIEPEESPEYNLAGKLLYQSKSRVFEDEKKDLNENDEWIECLQKLTYFARKRYDEQKSSKFALKNVIDFYTIGLPFDRFVTAEETKTLYKVWLTANLSNRRFKGALDDLLPKLTDLHQNYQKKIESAPINSEETNSEESAP